MIYILYIYMVLIVLIEFDYFFFQAEDGIRDGHVTGVQTCALPIYHENLFGKSSLFSVAKILLFSLARSGAILTSPIPQRASSFISVSNSSSMDKLDLLKSKLSLFSTLILCG